MKKFFENLSEKIEDAAFEAQLDDFTCEFDAINKPAEIVVSVLELWICVWLFNVTQL